MTGPLSRSMRHGALAPLVWWLALFLLLANTHVFAAGLEAHLDRTTIVEGDTVVLTLTTEGNGNGSPDLRPLSKDFNVLNQSQSTSMQFINGRTSSSREWQLLLAPKHSGKLSVPALHMGSISSSALSLDVLPAGQAAKLGKAQPVLLQVEVAPDKPYVQGQVIYTVRLLSRVPLQQASLSDPVADGATIQRMGNDRQSTTYHDGRSYQMVERRYAIFPQHSGKLHIQGPVLTAQVVEPNQGGQGNGGSAGQGPFSQFDRLFGQGAFGGMFGATRPVQLHARSLSVQVQPQPAGTPSPWLPAESVRLSEQWSPNPPLFEVGEPVTRSITIEAKGLSADQLPNLKQAHVPGIDQYPDQPESHTGVAGDTLVSRKVLKVALVPSRSGTFTLPAVKLAWWNSKTHQPEVATLPARTIQVKPAAAGATQAAPAVPPSTKGLPGASAPTQAPAPTRSPVSSGPVGGGVAQGHGLMGWLGPLDRAGHWPWVAGGFALLWLLSTGLWLDARRRPTSGRSASLASPPVAPRPDRGAVLQQCQSAFRANNVRAARQSLLDWGAACWPEHPPGQLEQLKQRLSPAAGVILDQLDRHLYAPEAGRWDGGAAWTLLEPLLRAPADEPAGQDGNPLPPLYPE